MIRRTIAALAIAGFGVLAFAAPASATAAARTPTLPCSIPTISVEDKAAAKDFKDNGSPCHEVTYRDLCDETQVRLANTGIHGTAKFRVDGHVYVVRAGENTTVNLDAPNAIVVELWKLVKHGRSWAWEWVKIDDHVWTLPRRCPTPSPSASPSASPTPSPSPSPVVVVTPSPVITISPSPVIVTIVDGSSDDDELPVTGTSYTMPIAVGGTLGVAGVILLGYALWRRRKATI